MSNGHKPSYQRVRMGTGQRGQVLWGFTLRCQCRFSVNVALPKKAQRKIYLDHLVQSARESVND